MCRAAISGIDQSKEYNGRIEVSAIEIERNGPSFAIDTVRELISLHPGKEFGWIIGSDAFRKIDQWHESDQLKEMVSFIVIERPEQGRDADEEFDLVEIDALEISATEIRARLIKRESIYELVPPAVSSYIESKGLYVSA